MTFHACGPFDYSESTVDPKAVIKDITTDPGTFTLVADGESTIDIRAELPADASPDRRTVTFKTTKGVFADVNKNETTAKAKFVKVGNVDKLLATVTLVSTITTGTAIVSVEIAEAVEKRSIELINARPESFTLIADKLGFEASFDNEITITALLKRSKGIPSVGNVVSLSVTSSDAQPHGYFRISEPESNTLGEAKFIFTLGTDLTPPNSITFTGEIPSASGQNKRATLVIYKK